MKKIKRIIAWICQKIIGRVRWLTFLKKVKNINKNSYYNALTKIVMERTLEPDSTSIDVGCNKGDILKYMMEYSTNGNFLAFEPLPDFYDGLVKDFPFKNVRIYNLALSDSKGTSSFNYVISNPAYSGLIKRPYDRPHEEDCQIEVNTDTLDNILESSPVNKVDLIKIDVEGGELLVLKGAINCLKENKPIIIFEHGPGSSQAYDFTSDDLFILLCNQCGLRISTMQDWLLGKPPLTQAEFRNHVYNRINYYFMAHK